MNDVIAILKYFAFSGTFVYAQSYRSAYIRSAFTILGVYGVWGPDWRPLSVVIPLALIKPVLYIVRVFNMSYSQRIL